MAFLSNPDPKENIEVIIPGDSAVTVGEEDYELYTESFEDGNGNEDFLNLDKEQEPTRYVMRKSLPFDAKQKLRSKNIKMVGDQMEFDVNYMTDVVRVALIDIKDHNDTQKTLANTYRRDKDGYAGSKLISHLEDLGQLTYLFLAYNKATSKSANKQKKK